MPTTLASRMPSSDDQPSPRDWEIYQRHVGEGESQQRLADEYDICQQRVAQICACVDTWFLASIRDKVGAVKGRVHMRLEGLYGKAIRAWTASEGQIVTVRRKVGTSGGKGTDEEVTETRISSGDPRHLNNARLTLADMRALWGLDAPPADDEDDIADQLDQMSQDDLEALARADEVRQRAKQTVQTTATRTSQE